MYELHARKNIVECFSILSREPPQYRHHIHYINGSKRKKTYIQQILLLTIHNNTKLQLKKI